MPSITTDDHAAAYAYLRELEASSSAPGEIARDAPSSLNFGAVGFGGGGPTYLDAFHTKRPPLPYELVNAYKSIAYACIGLNAKGVAKVPLRLYAVRRPGQKPPRRSHRRAPDSIQRRMRGLDDPRTAATGLKRSIDTNDEIDEILDHPLLDAVTRPNPYFDRELFLQYTSACLDALGAAYFYPERPAGPDGTSDPTWASSTIWPLQPQYVQPVKGTGPKILESYRYFSDNWQLHELVRIRFVSLRDPYLSGYAPLHACFEQTSLVDYYTATVEGILAGGARPETVMTLKDPLARTGPEERERYENEINKRFSRGRFGRVWVVDGAYQVDQLGHNPTDLGGLELTKEQRLLAANCFDVPISLLQLEDSNRATAQESTHQHQYYSIDPRCRLIASAFTSQWAQPVDERLFWFFDDPVMRDIKTEAEVWAMRVEKGQATRNEWREVDGLEPVDGGDTILVANNLVPLATAAGTAAAIAGTTDPATGPNPAAGDDQAAAKPTAAPVDDVQAAALNGAQISSLVEVIQNVQTGVIPPGSAKALLAASFPSLDSSTIDRIVDPIEVSPPAPATPPGPAAAAGKPVAAKPPADVEDADQVGDVIDPEDAAELLEGDDQVDEPKPVKPARSAPAPDPIDEQLIRVLGILEKRLTHGDPEATDGDDRRNDGGALPE